MKLLIVFISLLLLGGCATAIDKPAVEPEPDFVGVRDGHLVYRSGISKEANQALFEAYENAADKPERLLVSSRGGEIGLGLELGNWVKDNNLDVEVMDVCASSCANYIFPAAKTKYLRKDSVLLWHGSAWQEVWGLDEEAEKGFHEYLDPMRDRETQFYAELNVDNALPVYGQHEIGFLDVIVHTFKNGFGSTVGYDYSLEDMKRFGLSNIVLIDGEWDWRKYKPNNTKRVLRLAVSDDYEFKLRRYERGE
ncbi:hypothetical protein CWE22_08605 [Pseudidiomarina aestuarii]|uniref:Peptidase n=1 Tax=Pseudidiomarina aestuarii TaxID=624146 RepID=A0A7Z6ZVN9_9GAMM|nr:hypothetical protein [Pseudidiomarina aestuarii]RUO42191.1 hypothetical protein CWE22_08605 [Pseudidiomarina aestuarii]